MPPSSFYNNNLNMLIHFLTTSRVREGTSLFTKAKENEKKKKRYYLALFPPITLGFLLSISSYPPFSLLLLVTQAPKSRGWLILVVMVEEQGIN